MLSRPWRCAARSLAHIGEVRNLAGGGGKDLLAGGGGRDLLNGGGGRDTFHFQRGSGTDVIEDWRDGQDVIDINGAGFGDMTIIQHDVDVLIRFLNVQITVREADADLFTKADFIF